MQFFRNFTSVLLVWNSDETYNKDVNCLLRYVLDTSVDEVILLYQNFVLGNLFLIYF